MLSQFDRYSNRLRTFEVLSHCNAVSCWKILFGSSNAYLLQYLRESDIVDFYKLLHMVRPALHVLPLLTCSLLRSVQNCWKPSSTVTKAAEIFEAWVVLV